MPLLRGKISKDEYKLGHFDDSAAVLEFVCSARPGAAGGTGHLLPRPLPAHQDPPAGAAISIRPARTSSAWSRGLDDALAEYRADYAAYHERCKRANSPAVRDANPIIYLIPGVGMLSFAKDKATARIAGEFYVNAINVMRGAERRRHLCRPAGTGSLRHRILAARRSQAAAHAEAEEPGRPHRAGHRRRRRHRPGRRAPAAAGRRLRHADRHRRRSAGPGRRRAWSRRPARTASRTMRANITSEAAVSTAS